MPEQKVKVIVSDKSDINRIELDDNGFELLKWMMQNYDVFNCAMKTRPGRIILNQNDKGKIVPEYGIYNPEVFKNFLV